MTRSLGGAAAVAMCAALAVAPAAAADWQPGMASTKRYARTRVGNIAIARARVRGQQARARRGSPRGRAALQA